MNKVISIGNQGFEDIRKNDNFYIDDNCPADLWIDRVEP